MAVIESYLANFKDTADAQAIIVWGGPGPYKINNNFLEATGENFMAGGNDPVIADVVPSDIEFCRNHCFKRLEWQVSNLWDVKNLFELKNAQRVTVDGNLFENNWADAQTGKAILFHPRNQNGGAPWSIVADVTFTNNTILNTVSGISIIGDDDLNPSQQTRNIEISDNLIDIDTRGTHRDSNGQRFRS